MCDFLTGPDHKDRKMIAKLQRELDAERHACDALFSAMSQGDKQGAMSLYADILHARTTGEYAGIIDKAHIMIDDFIKTP